MPDLRTPLFDMGRGRGSRNPWVRREAQKNHTRPLFRNYQWKGKGLEVVTVKERTAVPAAQEPAKIGHNGGPPVEPFGLRAAWLRFATEMELRRLAKLHIRIERRKRSIADLIGERKLIMNRCIRRMRRADGKT